MGYSVLLVKFLDGPKGTLNSQLLLLVGRGGEGRGGEAGGRERCLLESHPSHIHLRHPLFIVQIKHCIEHQHITIVTSAAGKFCLLICRLKSTLESMDSQTSDLEKIL